MDRPFLDTLLERLAASLSADELDVATRPSEAADLTRTLHAGYLRIDLRLVPDPLPRVTLEVDPPADARELCAAWAIARPVAVSPDAHQSTWQILVAGDDLPDPYGPRIAAHSITAGRWTVTPGLTGRPAGELPGVVSGASPAYDVGERGGAVRWIEIAPTASVTRTLRAGRATIVTISDAGAPAAGAVLTRTDDGVTLASELSVVPGPRGAYAGVALLHTIEALAREQGCTRLRLDTSAFLLGDALPLARCGYAIGPPSAGDPGAEAWAEKDLTDPT